MIFSLQQPSRWRTIVLHMAVWAGIFSLIFFLESISLRPEMGPAKTVFMLFRAISVLVLTLVFYLNAYFLLPATRSVKKWVVFILLQLGLLYLYIKGVDYAFEKLIHVQAFRRPVPQPDMMIKPLPNPGFIPGRRRMPFNWITIFPFVLAVTASLAFHYIKESLKLDKQKRELELVSLASELQFLKSQVSPHFLFNVMNSLTYLARKKSSMLEPSIIKLSSLLRYMLYETEANNTLLDREISYLTDYIELQKLRYQHLEIITSFQSLNERAVIAPMLLIPFVENAFKHTASVDSEVSFISIKLLNKEDHLFFSVRNHYEEGNVILSDEASGIGLVNVVKRLEILYPNKHHLMIQKENNVFEILLEVKLIETI